MRKENPDLGSASVPGPDPSFLTTQQMLHETEGIRELIFREILALEKSLSTRMDAMDKATELIHDNMTRWPTQLDKEVAHVNALHDEKLNSLNIQLNEKFLAIDGRLRERDVRFESAEKSNKSAMENAFQAAKEVVQEQNRSFSVAVGKSEAATSKQIDQLGQAIPAVTQNMDSKISDLKERLTRIEGTGAGRSAGSQAVVAWIVAGFAVASTVVTIVISLLKFKMP